MIPLPDIPETIASAHFAKGCQDFIFLSANGFSRIKPPAKLSAGEQKATEMLVVKNKFELFVWPIHSRK